MRRHDNYPARDFQSHRPADRRGEAVDGPSNRSPVTRKNARNHPRQRADQRRWPRRHRSDRAPTSLPSSAPAPEKTRPPRPTAGTPHGVLILDKLAETDQKPISVDGPQQVNAPNDRTALFDRLHSCPPAGGVPHTNASRVKTARLLRMQSEIQAGGYGRMRRMRQSRYTETVR
jgi:hypothetical protein